MKINKACSIAYICSMRFLSFLFFIVYSVSSQSSTNDTFPILPPCVPPTVPPSIVYVDNPSLILISQRMI